MYHLEFVDSITVLQIHVNFSKINKMCKRGILILINLRFGCPNEIIVVRFHFTQDSSFSWRNFFLEVLICCRKKNLWTSYVPSSVTEKVNVTDFFQRNWNRRRWMSSCRSVGPGQRSSSDIKTSYPHRTRDRTSHLTVMTQWIPAKPFHRRTRVSSGCPDRRRSSTRHMFWKLINVVVSFRKRETNGNPLNFERKITVDADWTKGTPN